MKAAIQVKFKIILRRRRKRTVVGVGKFASGVSDLGSNKKHLRGFGS
jgi:hypothetical protein